MSYKNNAIEKLSVAIIIVGFNNEKTIQECLYSVFKNFFGKNPTKGQIIFIDNNSSDKTVNIVLKLREFYPCLNVIENKTNLGFAKAVNQGIKIAQKKYNPEFFMLLNPDAKIEADNLINKAVKRIKKYPNPIIVSPKITKAHIEYIDNPKNKESGNDIWFEGGKIDWIRQKVVHEPSELSDIETNKCFQSDFISGCAMIFNKKTIEKIGLLDERFFLFYEDTDFCLRAKKAEGKLIIFPDLEVCHIESASFGKKSTKTYHLVKSGLLFFHKHSSGWKRIVFWIRFYMRFLYHKFYSKKAIVLKAMKNFKEEI
jgi:GT2 family glycosyltransferase